VSLIMARAPEGTRRFRLPSPRVQLLAATALALEKLPFRAFLQGLSRGALKPGSCKNVVGYMHPNGPKFVGPMRAKVHVGYQTRPK
jgi:hypothetical protein